MFALGQNRTNVCRMIRGRTETACCNWKNCAHQILFYIRDCVQQKKELRDNIDDWVIVCVRVVTMLPVCFCCLVYVFSFG